MRLRQKITVMTGLVLVASVVKTVYEFSTAVDAASDKSHKRHHHHHYSHVMPTLPAGTDPRSNLSRGADTFWSASRGRHKSHLIRADTKIDRLNPRHALHMYRRGHNASSSSSSFSSSGAFALSKSAAFLSVPLSSMWDSLSSYDKTRPFLVIIVCSRPENTELRLAIRKSWGIDMEKSHVMLRFFVGFVTEGSWENIVKREQVLHGDIVRIAYEDTYENLSYKVLAAVSWALHNVTRAPYVMKIDDDTYVNVPYLLHELHNNSAMKNATWRRVMGAVCLDSPVVREDGDKWFVSQLDYPSDVYPPYVFGGGYVMTRAAAEGILGASLKAQYLHLEDVYVTGILARAAHVRHVSHPGFVFWTSKRATPCDMVTGRALTAVNMTSKQSYVMYSEIHALLRTGNWTRC